MAAIDNYNLSQDETFIKKCETLLLKSANAISGEQPLPGGTYPEDVVVKRGILCSNIYRSPVEWGKIFARVCAAQGTLSTSSTDNDIEFTINSVFNDVAGILYTELNPV